MGRIHAAWLVVDKAIMRTQNESSKFTSFYSFPLVESVELLVCRMTRCSRGRISLRRVHWQVLAHPRWPADATKRFGAPPTTVRDALLSGAALDHVRECAASLPAGVPRTIELDEGIMGYAQLCAI